MLVANHLLAASGPEGRATVSGAAVAFFWVPAAGAGVEPGGLGGLAVTGGRGPSILFGRFSGAFIGGLPAGAGDGWRAGEASGATRAAGRSAPPAVP